MIKGKARLGKKSSIRSTELRKNSRWLEIKNKTVRELTAIRVVAVEISRWLVMISLVRDLCWECCNCLRAWFEVCVESYDMCGYCSGVCQYEGCVWVQTDYKRKFVNSVCASSFIIPVDILAAIRITLSWRNSVLADNDCNVMVTYFCAIAIGIGICVTCSFCGWRHTSWWNDCLRWKQCNGSLARNRYINSVRRWSNSNVMALLFIVAIENVNLAKTDLNG